MLIYFEFSVCLLCSIDINIVVGQLPLGNIYRQQTMSLENSVGQQFKGRSTAPYPHGC